MSTKKDLSTGVLPIGFTVAFGVYTDENGIDQRVQYTLHGPFGGSSGSVDRVADALTRINEFVEDQLRYYNRRRGEGGA